MQNFTKSWELTTVQRNALCRSRRELSHAYSLANLASIYPRTNPVKFARSPSTDLRPSPDYYCLLLVSFHSDQILLLQISQVLWLTRTSRKATYGQSACCLSRRLSVNYTRLEVFDKTSSQKRCQFQILFENIGAIWQPRLSVGAGGSDAGRWDGVPDAEGRAERAAVFREVLRSKEWSE